jgi:hypothetical protein
MAYHKSMEISAHAIPRKKGAIILSPRRKKIARQFAQKRHEDRFHVRRRRTERHHARG